MVTPTGRVLALLELLQTAQLRTVRELATRLDVDERTVRRYVDRLVELDIPVESVRGRYGGYRIASGYRMPPLMFSDEEAVAVMLGLSRGTRSAAGSDIAAATALAKLRRALPPASKERLAALDTGSAISEAPQTPEAGVLLSIADAVRGHRALDLRYRNRQGMPSRRIVHPYDLVAHADHWYLLAEDVEKGTERTFRVDRIRTARVLKDTFSPPPERDAAAVLRQRLADVEHRWHVVLEIEASEERIRRHLPPAIAALSRIEPRERGEHGRRYRADIHAESLDWLPAVIVALACPVLITAPQELRALTEDAAKTLLDAARG